MLFLLIANSLFADMTSSQILKHADKARGNYSGIQWRIHLVSLEKDSIQKRTLDIKSKGFNCVATYVSPPKVKGRKLLMLDRNMMFIKPGLKKPVPISPRQKLLGKASNGDIASTNYAGDYHVTEMKDDTIDGTSCYFFDLKGKDKSVTYDRIKYWISKDKLVGVKAEYYTVSGKMLKMAQFDHDNVVTVQGNRQSFISKMIITDAIQKDIQTTLEYTRIRLKKIPDSAFNINLLMR